MATTASNNTRLTLGAKVTNFTLRDAHGEKYFLVEPHQKEHKTHGTVIVFACNHCPYVVHIADALGKLAAEYQPQGIRFLAINSNDAKAYPDDDPKLMPAFAAKHGWDFPYLSDPTQMIAKDFGAVCTPEIFVLNANYNLAYHGQFDDTRPRDGQPATDHDLRAALEAVLGISEMTTESKHAIGCGIKWIPGNEPE